MFWFFSHKTYGISVPRPGIEPILPALEGEIPTSGPPGKSPGGLKKKKNQLCFFLSSYKVAARLEKGMAACSSILAWRIPGTEKPGGLQPMGSQSQTRLSSWHWKGHSQTEQKVQRVCPCDPMPAAHSPLFCRLWRKWQLSEMVLVSFEARNEQASHTTRNELNDEEASLPKMNDICIPFNHSLLLTPPRGEMGLFDPFCSGHQLRAKPHVKEMCCCCSVAKVCPTLWDPMDCSTPGLPVHHHLLELAQTHGHWIGDAIQPSYPQSSPSPAPNLSQHQGLFQGVDSSHQVANVLINSCWIGGAPHCRGSRAVGVDVAHSRACALGRAAWGHGCPLAVRARGGHQERKVGTQKGRRWVKRSLCFQFSSVAQECLCHLMD